MFTEIQKQGRGKALAEAFFFRMDRELLVSLSKKLNRDEKIWSFGSVTGIRNPKVIECLVDAGFELTSLTAFTWAPIVFVAWADGHVDALEKAAILEALSGKGVSQEASSMMIGHEWFANRPTKELWSVWEEFSAAWLAGLDTEQREALIDEIVDLCYVVAHASGGFLGFGKVSQSETDVIDRVIKQQNASIKSLE